MSKWTERLPPYTIYKVIDNTNQNTVYVGLTKRTLQARLQAHSDHTDSPINELIKEKGKQNKEDKERNLHQYKRRLTGLRNTFNFFWSTHYINPPIQILRPACLSA